MAPKSNFSIPGVAEGKKIIGVPTGDESAMERVNALFQGSMSEESYQVSSPVYGYEIGILFLRSR